MKLKEIKDYIRDTVYKIDKDYANIIYYLIKNGFSGKTIRQIERKDIIIMFDNLYYNSEIIDSDIINDYNETYLIEKVGINKINKIKNNSNLFLVLNYYDANSRFNNSSFIFKYDYDIINEKKGQ
jgi:hypothetical protein